MPVRRFRPEVGVEAIVSSMEPYKKARRMLEVVTRRRWSIRRGKEKKKMMKADNRSML